MTDGQTDKYSETYPPKMAIKNNSKLKSRYMTIGFSRDHDARVMNQVAGAGSERGNFMFVDT